MTSDWYAREIYRQRRAARFKADLEGFRHTANKQSADLREVKAEYERVSLIYIKHLERLNARAKKILALQQANLVNLETHVANYQRHSLTEA